MLPGVGAGEYIVIAMLALVIIGPKDLPMLMRKAGAFINRLRGMAAEFRASFDDMARQSELDDLRKQVEELRSGQLMQPLTDEITPMMSQIDGDVRTSLSTDWSGAALSPGEEPDTHKPPARKRRAANGAKAPKASPKASPKTTPRAAAKATPRAAAKAPAKPAPVKAKPATKLRSRARGTKA